LLVHSMQVILGAAVAFAAVTTNSTADPTPHPTAVPTPMPFPTAMPTASMTKTPPPTPMPFPTAMPTAASSKTKYETAMPTASKTDAPTGTADCKDDTSRYNYNYCSTMFGGELPLSPCTEFGHTECPCECPDAVAPTSMPTWNFVIPTPEPTIENWVVDDNDLKQPHVWVVISGVVFVIVLTIISVVRRTQQNQRNRVLLQRDMRAYRGRMIQDNPNDVGRAYVGKMVTPNAKEKKGEAGYVPPANADRDEEEGREYVPPAYIDDQPPVKRNFVDSRPEGM